MRIILRPNGYVICALVAGAVASGWRVEPLRLLALWVVADLALGAWGAGLVRASGVLPWARTGQRLEAGEAVGAVAGAALAMLVAGHLGGPTVYLARAMVALMVVGALAGARRPERDAEPVLAGLQVLMAWALGLGGAAQSEELLLALGLVAGIGTWSRLRHMRSPGRFTLWANRVIWAVWAGMLLALGQPLLAGLVGVTALADDLQRLAPSRRALSEGVLTLGWLATWFVAALAVAAWGTLG